MKSTLYLLGCGSQILNTSCFMRSSDLLHMLKDIRFAGKARKLANILLQFNKCRLLSYPICINQAIVHVEMFGIFHLFPWSDWIGIWRMCNDASIHLYKCFPIYLVDTNRSLFILNIWNARIYVCISMQNARTSDGLWIWFVVHFVPMMKPQIEFSKTIRNLEFDVDTYVLHQYSFNQSVAWKFILKPMAIEAGICI